MDLKYSIMLKSNNKNYNYIKDRMSVGKVKIIKSDNKYCVKMDIKGIINYEYDVYLVFKEEDKYIVQMLGDISVDDRGNMSNEMICGITSLDDLAGVIIAYKDDIVMYGMTDMIKMMDMTNEQFLSLVKLPNIAEPVMSDMVVKEEKKMPKKYFKDEVKDKMSNMENKMVKMKEPEMKKMENEMPKMKEPEMKKIEKKMPEMKEPEMKKMENEMPEMKEPEMKKIEKKMPEMKQPEMKKMGNEMPKMKQPKMKKMENEMSEMKEPEMKKMENEMPKMKQPKMKKMENEMPEMKEPEMKKMENEMPEMKEPEMKKMDNKMQDMKDNIMDINMEMSKRNMKKMDNVNIVDMKKVQDELFNNNENKMPENIEENKENEMLESIDDNMQKEIIDSNMVDNESKMKMKNVEIMDHEKLKLDDEKIYSEDNNMFIEDMNNMMNLDEERMAKKKTKLKRMGNVHDISKKKVDSKVNEKYNLKEFTKVTLDKFVTMSWFNWDMYNNVFLHLAYKKFGHILCRERKEFIDISIPFEEKNLNYLKGEYSYIKVNDKEYDGYVIKMYKK